MTEEEKSMSEAIRVAVKTARPRRTVSEVAKAVGISDDVLYNLMNGRTRPDPDIFDRLRKALGLPVNWPFAEPVVAREGRRVSITGTPMAPLPVIGRASAGAGQTNVDPDQDVVYVPERLSQFGGLGWIIEGESMMPALEPGDIAIFTECRSPRRGYPFLVKSGDDYRIKNITWEDGEWVLRSLNASFPPEPLKDHELLGYLIAWYRARGSRETMDLDPGGLRLDLD